ncbi:MAG: glycosyltransferase family 2 protein [Anaerobutyricum hallii]
MKAKTLSIIIPVYNAEKYIENILRKLEEQKKDQVEIILIDDGSRDKSLEICQKFSAENEVFRVSSICE